MRLNAIAALRAPTMAITIQNSFGASGQPPEARMALNRANGRANTVCSNLIISRVILRRLKNGMVFLSSTTEAVEVPLNPQPLSPLGRGEPHSHEKVLSPFPT